MRCGYVCCRPLRGAYAGPDDIPRVLLTGDSWSGFLQLFRCFEVNLEDYPGLEDWGQRGSLTTEFGVRANEFNTAQYLDAVTAELEAYPTIDIVLLCLGGNDFLYGGWTPTMTPAEEDALMASVNSHTEAVIDHALAVRPNIRVVLCGYTFAHHAISGAAQAEINAAHAAFETTRKDLCLAKARTGYLHNLGLIQYHYGIPAESIAAGTVPYPGGIGDGYLPMPGGDPSYFAPIEALVDDDIHLEMSGYDYVTNRCLDEFCLEWLSWPVVLEILPLTKDAKAPQQDFQVTFSEAVTGVDTGDFAVSGGGASAGIVAVSGADAVYTVTADLDGAPGATLEVLDDDSIVDVDTNPLGGPDAGNGGFSYNGALRYADEAVAAGDFEACLAALDEAFKPAEWIVGAGMFLPASCDINGGSITIDPPGFTGNGMLDACEFGVLRACLLDGALDLSGTGGVTHGIAAAAWAHNLARMQTDVGGSDGRALRMLPGLDSILAGMMTLGDSASSSMPTALVFALNAAMEMPPGIVAPYSGNYSLLGQYFGPDGDADGDGYTNLEEYEYCMPIGGQALYIAAALDPGMAAGSDCVNTAGGAYDEGDAFCLTVPEPVDLGAAFQWYKDGQPLESGGFVSGTEYRELHIAYLLPEHSGWYSCAYDDGTKAPGTFGPVELIVEQEQGPAAQGWAMAALACVLCAAGAAALRRRARAIVSAKTPVR